MFLRKSKFGFTLIELLVVIVVIGILASLSFVALNSIRMKSRDAKRISDIKQMQAALELYFADENSYPTVWSTEQSLIGPTSGKTYMAKMPTDPMSAEASSYSYISSGNSYSIKYYLVGSVSNLTIGSNVAIPGSISASPCGSAVSYNGINYNVVWIDVNNNGATNSGECWFKENLATTQKPDGVTNLVHSASGDYVCPKNISDTAEDCAAAINGSSSVLGYMYKWATALNINSSCNTSNCAGSVTVPQQGICPNGWHIPTDSEWEALFNYAENVATPTVGSSCGVMMGAGCSNAGKVLKEVGTAYWNTAGGNSNDSLGLTIRGAGAGYGFRGSASYFWTATKETVDTQPTQARGRYCEASDSTFYSTSMNKGDLYSVRCVKN